MVVVFFILFILSFSIFVAMIINVIKRNKKDKKLLEAADIYVEHKVEVNTIKYFAKVFKKDGKACITFICSILIHTSDLSGFDTNGLTGIEYKIKNNINQKVIQSWNVIDLRTEQKQNIYKFTYDVELTEDFLDEGNNYNLDIEFTTHWQMGKEKRQINDSMYVESITGSVEEEFTEEKEVK